VQKATCHLFRPVTAGVEAEVFGCYSDRELGNPCLGVKFIICGVLGAINSMLTVFK